MSPRWFFSIPHQRAESSSQQDLSNESSQQLGEEPNALSCYCHPSVKHDAPHILCNACQRFISKCRWVQLRKLPVAQFSSLSRWQWKRGGAYVLDGDASESLNWTYEHSARDRTAGCHLCELIGTVWEGSVDDSAYADFGPKTRVELTVYYDAERTQDSAKLNVSASRDGGKTYASCSLKLCHEWKPSVANLTPKNETVTRSDAQMDVVEDKLFREVGKCTGSNASFSIAKRWIETCRKTHVRCNRAGATVQGNVYPSRLIYIGTGSEEPQLHEFLPNQPIPEYVTLSHCWGGRAPQTLTTANLQAFKTLIPFASLSKTFQEAIIVVRNLECQYIWIDSLCIIQDLLSDWEHESVFMGAIYRNSICTIAATASKNGDGGLFRLCNTLRRRPCQVWGDDEHRVYVDVEDDTVAKRYRREVNEGPLNSRAWVLQERVLSPRVIHFAENGVYWDCREAHLSDGGYEVVDNRFLSWGFGDGSIRLFDNILPSSYLPSGAQQQEESFSDLWQFNVERYCGMKLTAKSDRLIAFTGIIRYISESTGLECIFGLWKNHLLEHLLWRTEDALFSSRTRTTTPIPYWSWASISGHVRYFPPNNYNTAATFWYPDSEGGWPAPKSCRISDPNLVEDVVADVLEQTKLGVNPTSGYSAEKVICSAFIQNPSLSNDNEISISISGSLNVLGGAPAMMIRDVFTEEEEAQIMKAIRIQSDHSSATRSYRRLVCVWPDIPFSAPPADSSPIPVPPDLQFLRIHIQGAFRPKTRRFFKWPADGLSGDDLTDATDAGVIAPYALHTSGLVLVPMATTARTGDEADGKYRRVGFFHAMETFRAAPPPHPKGVDPHSEVFKASWFGEGCGVRTVKLV